MASRSDVAALASPMDDENGAWRFREATESVEQRQLVGMGRQPADRVDFRAQRQTLAEQRRSKSSEVRFFRAALRRP